MARIRSSCVAGQLGRYDFEIHYAAKEKLFEAKNHAPELEPFREFRRIMGNSEDDVERKFREVVKRYEATLDNWELYIVYKIAHTNKKETGFTRQGFEQFRKSLLIDYDLVYYNKVGDKEYYITKRDWDNAIEHKWKKSPQSVWGDYDVRQSRGTKRMKHTSELEAFFVSMCESMGSLIEKVIGILESPDKIEQLAANQTKLIT